MKKAISMPDNLICLSHLRWDFVYQRPQHLLNRFAKNQKVYFYEEPIFDSEGNSYLSISNRGKNVEIVVPHLKPGLNESQITGTLEILFDQFIENFELENCLFWYYTPMALKYTSKHKPKLVVYDCMDELSAFKFAHSDIISLEKQLMAKADLMFTGGHSLYEAKKQFHDHIFPFPSSIEKKHFEKSRTCGEAEDQQKIAGIKIGFFGVIDERFDIELIKNIAQKRPDWQLILIGPVVKIDESTLPRDKNIHYMGQKSYDQLPNYLCGWDIALIPFLLNESTRFISPTKTPEYLAASVPVISTPIRDVINPYGIQKLVYICNDCDEFVEAIEKELTTESKEEWLNQVDQFLKHNSWDKTHETMQEQIKNTIEAINKLSIAS
jgi:glycosyltransferase involved in cell wall biosynthesis